MSKRNAILITGGSGFLASWCIARAVQAGWKVHATLRNAAREPRIRTALAAEAEVGDRLTFFQTDLLSDAGWAEAMAGVKAVLHVASPFPSRGAPKESLTTPARDGT
ncbi:MAG: NAD-dependent epimerase/dehydratase family protein, partial [Hyphomonadaceae bacterium]